MRARMLRGLPEARRDRGDHLRLLGQAADDLEPGVLGAMAEADDAALQPAILDGPDRALAAVVAVHGGLGHQQRLVERAPP